jgi:hypothetical protein
MITDVGAVALGNVHTLNLRGTRVTDVGAVALGNVHALDVRCTEVTYVGAVALTNVHSLTDESHWGDDPGMVYHCRCHLMRVVL